MVFSAYNNSQTIASFMVIILEYFETLFLFCLLPTSTFENWENDLKMVIINDGSHGWRCILLRVEVLPLDYTHHSSQATINSLYNSIPV